MFLKYTFIQVPYVCMVKSDLSLTLVMYIASIAIHLSCISHWYCINRHTPFSSHNVFHDPFELNIAYCMKCCCLIEYKVFWIIQTCHIYHYPWPATLASEVHSLLNSRLACVIHFNLTHHLLVVNWWWLDSLKLRHLMINHQAKNSIYFAIIVVSVGIVNWECV